MSKAFENFLAFHLSHQLTPAYPRIMSWAYENGRIGTDALSNSASHFANVHEKLWDALCPSQEPITSITEQSKVRQTLDLQLGAIIVNTVFSGIDQHLASVEKRREAYKHLLVTTASLTSGPAVDAATTATANLDGGAVSGTIGKIANLLLTEVAKEVGELNEHANPTEMRKLYASLYKAVSTSNSRDGRFIVSQPVFIANEMRALERDTEKSPENPSEKTGMQSPGTIRKHWNRIYGNKITVEKYAEIYDTRRKVGLQMAKYFEFLKESNTFTPPFSID